ncbi:MAG: hypothetical protein O7E52_07875 [Candidatus Poribacteria bacterium]|nr:hypothetical protein [Candidatus Poribacteria bacterium]
MPRIPIAPKAEPVNTAKAAVSASGLAQPGDRVVIIAGMPGTTNMIKADVL